MSAGGDLGGAGGLVGGLLVLGALEGGGAAGFVERPPLLSQLLEGGRDLHVSLLFLPEAFGLGGHHFLSSHLNHKLSIL